MEEQGMSVNSNSSGVGLDPQMENHIIFGEDNSKHKQVEKNSLFKHYKTEDEYAEK